MSRAPVDLRVAGQSYRVVTSAAEPELRALAAQVEQRMRDIAGPGRAIAQPTLLLAAISLAHDLEQERDRRRTVESRSRELLANVLERIDDALAVADEDDESDEPRPSLDT